MTNVSEEEQECFLNAEERKVRSLSEVDDIHVSFADGCPERRESENRCRMAVTRCQSFEALQERTQQCACTHKALSKSVSIINDNKTSITEETLDKVNSVSEKLLQGNHSESCKYNIVSRPHALRQPHEQIVHYVDSNTNNGVVAVALQHIDEHVLADLRNDNESVFLAMQQQQQNRAFAINCETSQSSDSVICRICHSAGDEKLIAPCKCSGSSRYVHEPCLITWFKRSVKNECELCKSVVKIKKVNHSFTRWRKPEDRPIPLIWFSVFFIGLFLNILSIHVNASEYCKSTACLIFYIVNGFGIILDSAFLYFWSRKCQHYCKKWFALNQDWFIDDLDSANDVMAVQYVRNDCHNQV